MFGFVRTMWLQLLKWMFTDIFTFLLEYIVMPKKKEIANACSDELSQDTIFCTGDKMPGKTGIL